MVVSFSNLRPFGPRRATARLEIHARATRRREDLAPRLGRVDGVTGARVARETPSRRLGAPAALPGLPEGREVRGSHPQGDGAADGAVQHLWCVSQRDFLRFLNLNFVKMAFSWSHVTVTPSRRL